MVFLSWRHAGIAFIVFALGPWLLMAPGAQGQQPAASPGLEQRVHELEDTVRRLQGGRTPVQNISVQPVPTPASGAPEAKDVEAATAASDGSSGGGQAGGSRILAGWDDKNGFFIRSADDRYRFRVTGQIQADYRAFLDGRDYTDIDTFLVRRARLGIEANMFQYYEFRLLPDFSNAQGPGVFAQTRLQEAYVNVLYRAYFT